MYVSAYEAALDRTNMMLASVVNTTARYRGGGNNADWDGTYRSLLGLPATVVSREDFRTYARKRKVGSYEWNEYTNEAHKAVCWLFYIEYGTRDSQKAYNPQLTSEGFRQGGLGAGVTTFDWSKWTSFNGNMPFIPCGTTDALGNSTGVIEYAVDNKSQESPIKQTFSVPRYRGIENPFGHICLFLDGIFVTIGQKPDYGGDGLSKVYVCSDPSKFNENNHDGWSLVGYEARENGFVCDIIFGDTGEIIPKSVGGSSTTHFCDFHDTSIANTENAHILIAGGSASYGAGAGLSCFSSGDVSSDVDSQIGARLCFIPEVA